MRRAVLLALALALCCAVPAWAAVDHGFDHPASPDTSQQLQTPRYVGPNVQRDNTPNDPAYDSAEPDDPDHGRNTSIYDEQFDLFGFASRRTPTTVYTDTGDPRVGKLQIAGFNAAGAWKETRGDPNVTVAILDTGIKWDRVGLRLQVHLNRAELPPPQGATSYDANHDGVFNVDDYKNDPRVRSQVARPQSERNGPVGLVTGQDVIRAFSNHTDSDHNGFVDDIAGWDFFNDDNDPYDQSSYFAASNHGSGRTSEAVEQGNEGKDSIGVCPKCQFVPIRVWDTFVSDGDTFGLGIFYAANNGVKVIEGADGSLYHSRFTERASQYAYEKGVTQTYSGDDLNTANHNYPANYNHTMLIQGTVPDTVGLGQSNEITSTFAAIPVPTNLAPGTFFRGANTTQFGGHSSISMEGPTGSTNTGKASGAAALVISAAKKHGIDLSADETREIMEQTAEDVLPGNTGGAGVPDPAAKGWDSHFGYGRADVGKAVSVAIDKTKVPPEASIDSPDWFAPVTGSSVRITGRARARFAAGGFHWELQTCPTFQTGQGDGTCTTRNQGDAAAGQTVTDFGTINPQGIAQDAAPDPAGPVLAPGVTNPFKGQFTVRLVVTEPDNPAATPGVDRKVLTALDDATLRPGYPKRLGTGGEAPIRYADLNGDNVQEFIVPLEDGTLHAYEPNGSELPGWPVRTGTLAQAAPHAAALSAAAVAPPLEPLRGATVADIDGDGRPEVIDAAGTHLYVWDARGRLRKGFPVSINPAFCRGADQRQSKPVTHRKCGFLASPALGHLEGRSKPLDIVVSALDGHVYAFRPDGSSVPHFPFELVDKSMAPNDRVYAESINDPAVGDLNGDGKDDVVVASNENYGVAGNPDLQGGFAGAIAYALGKAAGGTSRVYAINGATGALVSGAWPLKLPGGIQSTLPLVGPGHDASLARMGGQQRIVVSTTGGAIGIYDTAGKKIKDLDQAGTGPASNVPEKQQQLNLFESASLGNVDGSGLAVVKYGVTLAQAANLVLAGQNVPYEHVINAIKPNDAPNGKQLGAFPTITDDYQFLSASNVAKVGPSGNQVLAGTGLGLLHAYNGTDAKDAPGFPKVTGGWLFAPAALSDDHRIADITREGYLFEWNAPNAPACQTEWPSFRHDDHQTGNYDADGTAPGTPRGLTLRELSSGRYRLAFTSPGNDRLCGTAASYVTEANGRPIDLRLGRPAAGGAGFSRDVSLPDGTSSFTLRARDEAGNDGSPASVRLAVCRDRIRPTLRYAPGGVRGGRRTILLRGTASDRGCAGSAKAHTVSRRGAVRSVTFAVSELVRGGCRFVRADGRLTGRQSCRRPLFVRAKGTDRWELTLHGRYPAGRYVVRSRVYDRAGNVGRPAPRSFRIRSLRAHFAG